LRGFCVFAIMDSMKNFFWIVPVSILGVIILGNVAYAVTKYDFAKTETATSSILFVASDVGMPYKDSMLLPLSAPKNSELGAFVDIQYDVVCYTYKTALSCVKY